MARPRYRDDRADSTKRQDRRIYDELRDSFGTGMLRDLRDRHVKIIRDHYRQKFSTSIADDALGRISVLWQFADQHLDIDLASNPTVGVARVYKGKKEHEPWPDDVLAAGIPHVTNTEVQRGGFLKLVRDIEPSILDYC